jgi:hypothetical protein
VSQSKMRCKLIFHQIFENNIFFFIQVPIVKPPSLSDVLLGDDEFLLERRKRQSGILIEFAQFTNTVKYKNHLSINTHPRNCPK